MFDRHLSTLFIARDLKHKLSYFSFTYYKQIRAVKNQFLNFIPFVVRVLGLNIIKLLFTPPLPPNPDTTPTIQPGPPLHHIKSRHHG